ncbi:tubulin-like doman-containing protein [Spirosoma sp. 209]|uniref:tubulin-like doman-containing protein n=1 Tax=Spirosoma sp. 209 TaxID=1955701 RepID=UPI0013747AAE|nr:tubulin-like doman-containing protein [Spirosoma sp. 209]
MNNLIIGLGGTGGKIIRAFRKTIFQEFRTNTPDSGVNINYLYIDTNERDLQESESWRVLGTSVALGENSKLLLKNSDLNSILSELNSHPGIKDWIGDAKEWAEFLSGMAGLAMAGGQKRRLGRFLLAANADELSNRIKLQVAKLQENGQQEVHFHICCGLAGGTGSGSLIDVIAQIRKLYVPNTSFKYAITLYLFLPELNAPQEKIQAGFYHANGYAALRELNALGVGSYLPIDVSTTNTNGKTRFTNSTLKDPFLGAYLFSNINQNGNTVDVDEELPTIVTDFIYQKLVSLRGTEIETKISSQENNENGVQLTEQSAESKTPERSLRFLGFGVKRIATPEEEIREFITYSFARQATYQLRYNFWNDEIGFRNLARNWNFGEEVADKKTQEKWRLTLEHLQLSLPITEDAVTKKWMPIGDTWRMVMPNFKELAKSSTDTNWLDELQVLCDKYYNESYRNMGVRNFYEAKAHDLKALAREVVNRVEKEVFTEWRNGVKSLYDIKQLLEALADNLVTRRADLQGKIVRNNSAVEETNARALANKKSWADMGLFSRTLGKPKELLNAQGAVFEELYIYKTQAEGLQFAIGFVNEILEQFTELRAQVETANKTLDEALKVFEKNIEERCNDKEEDLRREGNYKKQVIRFYEPEKVREVTKRLERDKKQQDTQTSNVRKALIDPLGNDPSFRLFNTLTSQSHFIATLEKTCDHNARTAEASLENKDRLFDVGIIAKLKALYGSREEDLRKYVKKLVDYSGYFLILNQNEVNRVGDGAVSNNVRRTFTVILPDVPEHRDFVEKLQAAFQEAVQGVTVQFAFSSRKKHEIVLLSLINGLPLRYVELVGALGEKYNERIAKEDGKRAKLFLHTEGDGSDLPRLFLASELDKQKELERIQHEAIPHLLLAHTMGFLEEKEDENGYQKWAFVQPNDFGRMVPMVFMDKKLSQCYLTLTRQAVQLIENAVQPRLASDYKHKVKKDELKQSLIALVKHIAAERGNEDRVYILHEEAAGRLIDTLKSE